MKFADIAGHEDIKKTLRSLADEGKVPHAMLFSGVSGLGKMRMARAFAQYLHCKNRRDGDSCGVCPSCLQHQKFNNPDVHFIYPVKKKGENTPISKDYIEEWREMLEEDSYMRAEKWNELLKTENSQPVIYVSESEEIITRASLSAYQEDLKVFIIWQPEKMRPEAANKILKILEEPFEDTVFILVSNNDSLILPTILSRTRRFNFHPLENREILKVLMNEGIAQEEASAAAELSEGRVGRARELVSGSSELHEFTELFKEIMRACYALNAARMKEFSENISSLGRSKIIRFLEYCGRMIRENFIYNMSLPSLRLMTKEEESFSSKFSPFVHEGNVEKLIAEIARAAGDIERNCNSKIVLFDLLLILSRYIRKPRVTTLPFEPPV